MGVNRRLHNLSTWLFPWLFRALNKHTHKHTHTHIHSHRSVQQQYADTVRSVNEFIQTKMNRPAQKESTIIHTYMDLLVTNELSSSKRTPTALQQLEEQEEIERWIIGGAEWIQHASNYAMTALEELRDEVDMTMAALRVAIQARRLHKSVKHSAWYGKLISKLQSQLRSAITRFNFILAVSPPDLVDEVRGTRYTPIPPYKSGRTAEELFLDCYNLEHPANFPVEAVKRWCIGPLHIHVTRMAATQDQIKLSLGRDLDQYEAFYVATIQAIERALVDPDLNLSLGYRALAMKMLSASRLAQSDCTHLRALLVQYMIDHPLPRLDPLFFLSSPADVATYPSWMCTSNTCFLAAEMETLATAGGEALRAVIQRVHNALPTSRGLVLVMQCLQRRFHSSTALELESAKEELADWAGTPQHDRDAIVTRGAFGTPGVITQTALDEACDDLALRPLVSALTIGRTTVRAPCSFCGTTQTDETNKFRFDLVERHLVAFAGGEVGLQSIVDQPDFLTRSEGKCSSCDSTVQVTCTITNVPLVLAFTPQPSLKERVSFPESLIFAGYQWSLKGRIWAHRPDGVHFSSIIRQSHPPDSPGGAPNPPGVYLHDSATNQGRAMHVDPELPDPGLVGRDDHASRPCRFTEYVMFARGRAIDPAP
jgi:hypothetical protein